MKNEERNVIITKYITSITKAANNEYKVLLFNQETIEAWILFYSDSSKKLEEVKAEIQSLVKATVENYLRVKQRRIIGLEPKAKEVDTNIKVKKLGWNIASEKRRQEILKQKSELNIA